MCTVSWTAAHGGYDLFFNRDELNTRAAEAPPESGRRDGVAYLAPRDGAHGGTWLLANEFGLTICLLNDYGAAWRPAAGQPRFSRGHIVLACATAATHAEVIAALQAQPLAATPAFQLVALAPEEGPLLWHWQGAQLVPRHASICAPPISSSSFATGEVIAQRTERFASFVRSPRAACASELAAYHRQHAPEHGAHSVLMRRSDAATRSIIHVAADEHSVRLDYEPILWTAHGPAPQTPTRLRLNRHCATMGA